MWTYLDHDFWSRLPRKPLNGSLAPTETWASIAEKLEKYQAECVDDDWDGQGAAAIPAGVIDGAKALVKLLEARGYAVPDWVVPTFDCSIAIEWNDAAGTTIELDVKAPNCLVYTAHGPKIQFETRTISDEVTVA